MRNTIVLLGIILFLSCSKSESKNSPTVLPNTPVVSTPIAPSIPTGLKSTPGYYSIMLSWDNPNNQNIKTCKIYRDTSIAPSKLYKEIPFTTQFKDDLVSLTKKYYYKISITDNNNLESNLSAEVNGIAQEPVNINQPINGEIGGIDYAFLNFGTPVFTKISHTFTIYNEPANADSSLNKDGIYYQFYQGIINDTIGFYYGIQTSVMNPNGINKKGIIFSRWNTRDILNYKIANGGWGQSAGYEGNFIGVRINYEWSIGTYTIELKKDSSDSIGDWYGLWILNANTKQNTYCGSIRFETSTKSSGIKDNGITWTELYAKADKNTPLPMWHVSVDEVLADNKAPISVTSDYNKNTFVGFSNIFTTNNKDFHFLMGPKVLTYKSAGKLW
jgi:hypothetical protein